MNLLKRLAGVSLTAFAVLSLSVPISGVDFGEFETTTAQPPEVVTQAPVTTSPTYEQTTQAFTTIGTEFSQRPDADGDWRGNNTEGFFGGIFEDPVDKEGLEKAKVLTKPLTDIVGMAINVAVFLLISVFFFAVRVADLFCIFIPFTRKYLLGPDYAGAGGSAPPRFNGPTPMPTPMPAPPTPPRGMGDIPPGPGPGAGTFRGGR